MSSRWAHRELTVTTVVTAPGPMITAQSWLGEVTAQSRRGHSSITASSVWSRLSHGSVTAGCDHFGHSELTVSSLWAHGEQSRWPIFFSWDAINPGSNTSGLLVPGRYVGDSFAGLGKAKRIGSSLRADWLSCFSFWVGENGGLPDKGAWCHWGRNGWPGRIWQSIWPVSLSLVGLTCWPSRLERWLAIRIPVCCWCRDVAAYLQIKSSALSDEVGSFSTTQTQSFVTQCWNGIFAMGLSPSPPRQLWWPWWTSVDRSCCPSGAHICTRNCKSLWM